MIKGVLSSMKNETKKPIDKKRFIEMVYDYGASGDKTLSNLKENQKDAIRQAWATFNAEDEEEETDNKFGDFYTDFAGEKGNAQKFDDIRKSEAKKV